MTTYVKKSDPKKPYPIEAGAKIDCPYCKGEHIIYDSLAAHREPGQKPETHYFKCGKKLTAVEWMTASFTIEEPMEDNT